LLHPLYPNPNPEYNPECNTEYNAEYNPEYNDECNTEYNIAEALMEENELQANTISEQEQMLKEFSAAVEAPTAEAVVAPTLVQVPRGPIRTQVGAGSTGPQKNSHHLR